MFYQLLDLLKKFRILHPQFSVLLSPLLNFLPRLGCLVAAKSLHKTLLNGILHAPIAFFDKTPVGRILSRFSKDVEALDTLLPRDVAEVIYSIFEVDEFELIMILFVKYA